MHCEGYGHRKVAFYGLIMKGLVLNYMGTVNAAPEWLLR